MPGIAEDIWEALRDCFKANAEPLTKAQVLAWIGNNYPNPAFTANAVGAQLYRSCANVRAMQRYKTPKFLVYDRHTHTYSPVGSSVLSPLEFTDNPIISPEDEAYEQGEPTFALEAHLRDYLVRNLPILEKGLKLWSDSPPSVEYFVGGRRVDLLARDVEGNPVVIELKLNRGYDKVIGQALLYQGLVTHELKTPKVRIILVANEVSDELKIACSQLSHVTLFEYAITMRVEKVSSVIEEGI